MDTIYRVSFYKKLTGDTGHPAEPCQGVVEVHGETRERAIEHARHKFADLKGVNDWSIYADYEVVEELPARKRISESVYTKSLENHALDVTRR
jgi:hypothetical protein